MLIKGMKLWFKKYITIQWFWNNYKITWNYMLWIATNFFGVEMTFSTYGWYVWPYVPTAVNKMNIPKLHWTLCNSSLHIYPVGELGRLLILKCSKWLLPFLRIWLFSQPFHLFPCYPMDDPQTSSMVSSESLLKMQNFWLHLKFIESKQDFWLIACT